MYVYESYENLDVTMEEEYFSRKRSGEIVCESMPVLVEHEMEVYVNDRLTEKLTCTPQHLAELVLGRLFTDGLVRSTDEITSISICESGRRAQVVLADDRTQADEEVPRSVRPIPWEETWIFAMADQMENGLPIHSSTWAAHSCFLSLEGKVVFVCEDIGRHNAMDKVIGYALRNQIDLKRCVVYSSGRVPTDMMMKVVRAGIPVLAAKAVPTRESIELAKEYGVTLICAARCDRIRIYHGYEGEDGKHRVGEGEVR